MRSFVLALALLPLIQCTPLPENGQEYFDILGTGSQDWRLVFRGTAHIEKSIFDAYKNGAGCPEQVEDGCKNTDWKAPCQNHYRNNDAIENWKNVREVLYGIVDQGNLVKVMRFKGQNTDYLNWMSRKRLIDSCWDDLKKADQNYFG
ncbi:hypothetical protein EGW08_013592 [Elysia chlorotica]|uniref:Uncharacterized protein n=1 Tax=Elysia chlorotica TaxID=188477 RepID=A0A3S0ZIM9_ELYCH|nr:hypothetical protein EGW08_013592 [Elysia chlorotica]